MFARQDTIIKAISVVRKQASSPIPFSRKAGGQIYMNRSEWESAEMTNGRLEYGMHKMKKQPIVNPFPKGSKQWMGYEDEKAHDLISKQFKEVMQ